MASGRSKDAVIANEIRSWGRDECGELLDEFQRRESDVSRTVTPATLECVDQTAVGKTRKSLRGDGRPCGVSAQTLEASSVAGGYSHIGMQAQATDVRAAPAASRFDPLDVDPVAEA
jgi:hypothetical protein